MTKYSTTNSSGSEQPTPPGGEQPTPGVQVREGVALLVRWFSRSEVRRQLFGPAAAELSPMDAALLEHLTRHGPIRVSDLAGQWGVTKSTMTLQVRRLADKGLIDRAPDPGDGRAALVSISGEGIELQHRIAEAGAALFDEMLATWPQSDREALGSLLLRFAHQFAQQIPLPHEATTETPTPSPTQPPTGTVTHD